MRIIAPLTAALLMMTGACGERARFQPTQNVNAVSPSGRPAASYELHADQTSDGRITVNVWSEGATRDEGRTFFPLAVEVRNRSEGPIELDRNALALEAFNLQGTPLPAARLESTAPEEGSFKVAPRSASTFKLRFELTMPMSPSEIGALRFRWGVVRDDGDRYVQFTEFRREPEYLAAASHVQYDPVYGFYDPFFYGSPYVHHANYYVPVRRVIVERRPARPAPSLH